PRVVGVGRRILRNPSDAEDALQATFLILAHKAQSIARQDDVAGWLYGVARKTSLKARELAQKRQRREHSVADVPDPGAAPAECPDPDLASLLEEELSRLSESHRGVI